MEADSILLQMSLVEIYELQKKEEKSLQLLLV